MRSDRPRNRRQIDFGGGCGVGSASERGPVVITRNGRAVAVLIGIQDEDEIERLLMAYSPQLRAILDKSRQQIREGQYLSHEEFWAQFKVPQPAKKEPRKARRVTRRVPINDEHNVSR